MSDVEKGLAEWFQILEEAVRAERSRRGREAERWSRVVEETERKMDFARTHQKERFGNWKLQMEGEHEEQMNV